MTNTTLPATLTVRGTDKAIIEVPTSNWTSEFITYMVQYAWDVRMQRCTAGADKGTDDFAKKETAMLESMRQGLVPTRGGGASIDIDSKIESRYLAEQGIKGKIADLEPRWLEFAKATVLNSVESADKVVLQTDPLKLAGLAEEYLKAVKESARDSKEFKKIEAELKQPKKALPGLKISIS